MGDWIQGLGVTYSHIMDRSYLQRKRIVVHWGLFAVGWKFEPWVIALDVMSQSGYVRRSLLEKERFHLCYLPEDLWMHTKKDQLGSLWR